MPRHLSSTVGLWGIIFQNQTKAVNMSERTKSASFLQLEFKISPLYLVSEFRWRFELNTISRTKFRNNIFKQCEIFSNLA